MQIRMYADDLVIFVACSKEDAEMLLADIVSILQS